jgi:hypothetical protein
MDRKLYYGSVAAEKLIENGKMYRNTGYIGIFSSLQQAQFDAYQGALLAYPVADGWYSHQVAVGEAPEEFVRNQLLPWAQEMIRETGQ